MRRRDIYIVWCIEINLENIQPYLLVGEEELEGQFEVGYPQTPSKLEVVLHPVFS